MRKQEVCQFVCLHLSHIIGTNAAERLIIIILHYELSQASPLNVLYSSSLYDCNNLCKSFENLNVSACIQKIQKVCKWTESELVDGLLSKKICKPKKNIRQDNLFARVIFDKFVRGKQLAVFILAIWATTFSFSSFFVYMGVCIVINISDFNIGKFSKNCHSPILIPHQ